MVVGLTAMLARFAHWIVRYPAPVLVGLAIVTAAASWLAVRIPFDFAIQAVFAGGDDLVRDAEEFKRTFRYEDSVLMVVVEATGAADVLAKESLTWQVQVARLLDAVPRVNRIEAVATMQVPRINFARPFDLEANPLIHELPVDDATESRVREVVNRSKLAEGSLLSADRTVAALLLFVDPEARDLADMRAVVTAVRALLHDHPPPDGYRLHLSGLPALRVDIVDNLQQDQAFLLPLAGTFFLAALGLAFRRISGSLVPLLSIGIGLAWTLGMMVLMGESFNIISNILPVLLMIIGVSNSAHIVARYAEDAVATHDNRRLAAERAITHMSKACFLTLLTTAVGFFSLMTARSDVLRDFGWQTAMGLGFLYFSMLITLGSMLPFFRPPRHGIHAGRRQGLLTYAVLFAEWMVLKHRTFTLVATTVLTAASVWAGKNVIVNSYVIETYDEDHPTVRTMRLIERKLAGLMPLEISLRADNPERFFEPQNYRRIAELEEFATQHEAVLLSRSYVDLFQEIYANVKRDQGLRDELPALGAEGADRIAAARRYTRRVADLVQYDAFLTPDETRARILLKLRDVGTRDTLVLIRRLEAKIAELFGPESGITARLTGDAYVNAKALDMIIRDLLTSFATASLIIFGIIAVLFRSLRLGLIATLPNVTPLLFTLGYMGLRGYHLNMGNVIVFAISLGIAVDNTIHYLFRFREEMKIDHDRAEAAQRSLHGTGRAIVLTSLLTVCGLAVLMFSDFVPTRRFAELTSLTMAAALLGDLFLLPACLVLFGSRRE
jgi:predicted RND superfamily exporter protein